MNYYVTTSIPYVNGEPHIGFAMELIQADVLARHARLQKKSVIFSTGTDEHGLKIAEKAIELKITPEQLSDQMSVKFRELEKLLNVTNDFFIRTTDSDHINRAQAIWLALADNIYKAKYSGWYDVRQEEFVPAGKADPERVKPEHPQAYQKLEEENYFFKLSAYTGQIKNAIETNAFKIIPSTKRNEVLRLLKDGLEDISISRPKEKLEWGIPVPNDDAQVMYVWFEALMNYLTVLGYPDQANFKEFWPPNVQVIGKDIVRFHAAILPAMLFALDLALTDMLYVHGFINIEGEKISKSLGNVVSPAKIVNKYGVDAFRYYFLRHIPSYDDGDFSWQKLHEAYQNELGNELGNAVQRTLAMIQSYLGGNFDDENHEDMTGDLIDEFISECKFDRALDEIWAKVKFLNQYIEENKPWQLKKEQKEDNLKKVLFSQVAQLKTIAKYLKPFLPDTAEKIEKIFAGNKVTTPDTTLFPRIEELN